MHIQPLIVDLADRLTGLYDPEEAARIACYAMEDSLGISKLDRSLTLIEYKTWQQIVSRLLMGEPLQYVTGKAFFYDMTLQVGPGVLIPRPETEELIFHALPYFKTHAGSIMDLGTGSGCIALTLAKSLVAPIYATDFSKKALDIAQANARTLQLSVTFLLSNMLSSDDWDKLPTVSHYISNPPYIAPEEADSLHRNVRDHEPPEALFTPVGASPILFYDAILQFAVPRLQRGGSIWLELHPQHADKVLKLAKSYKTVKAKVIDDMSGRPHFMKVVC
jgi:release factor glutamine methyltransferase